MSCLSFKLQHFKEVEIAMVRMKEKAKFHTEFDKLKQELERTYEMKAKALMEREKNSIDRIQKQQEVKLIIWIFVIVAFFQPLHTLKSRNISPSLKKTKLLHVFFIDWKYCISKNKLLM